MGGGGAQGDQPDGERKSRAFRSVENFTAMIYVVASHRTSISHPQPPLPMLSHIEAATAI